MDNREQSPFDPNAGDAGESADRHEAGQQALEGLIETNRIQLEGIFMATEGPISPGQVARVIANYKAYCAQHDLSNHQTARGIDFSASVISEWVNGKYSGDVATVTRRVNSWLERDARRRAAKRPTDFISTNAAEQMGAMIQLADKLTSMLAIVADSGAGKTRVLRYWADSTNGIMVTCVSGMRPRNLYQRLAETLGMREDKSTRMDLLQAIITKLAGTKRIIFVDEAHLLGQHIGCLRPIFDLARVPIVMAGAGEILSQIDSDRGHGVGQMASRTLRCDLTKASTMIGGGRAGKKSPAVLFTMEEIAKFFAMKKMRITRDGLAIMFALANLSHRGRLRLVENLADTIFNSNPNLSAISRRDVVAALELTAGDMAEALLRDAEDSFESPATAVARAG